MRKLILFITVIFFISSCSEKKSNDKVKEDKAKDVIQNIKPHIDTILEIANPEELNLGIHQLYLDTTKSNMIYKFSENNIANQDDTLILSYIKSWNESFEFKELEYTDVSLKWRTIRKKGNDFYLYDRCDGGDPEFEIYKNVFIFNEALERDFQPIEKVLKISKKEIWLELSKYPTNGAKDISFINISQIDSLQGIYLFNHKTTQYERKQYVIPMENCKYYNLIVNHCPTEKVEEYFEFENSTWQIKK